VLTTLSKHKITKSDIDELNELSVTDVWQYLMEFYRLECAGALATGDKNYDLELIKSDKEYLNELWELNKLH
jgi:hypothetical protein